MAEEDGFQTMSWLYDDDVAVADGRNAHVLKSLVCRQGPSKQPESETVSEVLKGLVCCFLKPQLQLFVCVIWALWDVVARDPSCVALLPTRDADDPPLLLSSSQWLGEL